MQAGTVQTGTAQPATVQAGSHMRFAIAIHMLQRSNPATRQGIDDKRRSTRRHLKRADQRTELRHTA
jgi:hypothetical protein